MPLVWSIDEVVVLGETADRFRCVHCAKRHSSVLNTCNKKNIQARTSCFTGNT